MKIVEIKNPNNVKMNPIKEKMDIYVPDIRNQNISRRNGMIYALTGSGGSGKTNLLLNEFRNKNYYRNKFHNIYYFCPISSFLSLDNHPFAKHDKVYHDLSVGVLEMVYNDLVAIKEQTEENIEKLKAKKKNKGKLILDGYGDTKDDESDVDEEDIKPQYSVCIIDDFADALKNLDIQKQLNKMLIKARHICCGFIFTLQSFHYFPKILRKQLTYCSIFKPKNIEEWYSIANEILNLNKDDALKLYDYCFNEPYAHLDIDTTNNKIYKNFNELKIIS
jgi:hypothetical protein